MLRTVLSVSLAAALLAVSLPAVDSARLTHAETSTETSLQRLDAAATELAKGNDPVPPDSGGARRQLTLRLPRESWGSVALDEIRFPPLDADRLPTWRVVGGNRTTLRPSVPLVGPPGGLSLREGGRQRVILTLQRRNGHPVVVVTRPNV